ncbi:MAG TPA: GNAT family N-acetyltransferase [Herpetosiphonaceae bacterium]
MTIFESRPYGDQADLPAIVALIDACEAVDQLDRSTSVEELRGEVEAPSVDPRRDLRLWHDQTGRLVGWGQLAIPEHGATIDGRFWMRIHPQARDDTLEPEILAWAEARVREVGQERQQSAQLLTGARSDQTDRLALLSEHGFAPVRYFFTMRRSLETPIEPPQVPPGFTIRPFQPGPDDDQWIELGNLAFRDHWNHHDATSEDLQHELAAPHFRPDLYQLAIAPDGSFAAYCQCEIMQEQNERLGRAEGFVLGLGTHPGFRKLGLGRALLLNGLHQLKAAGMNSALISVDAENASGALRLYESVGFQTFETWIMLHKPLQPS